jgi:hypothetical protein
MKKRKSDIARKKLTPLQLAKEELKGRRRAKNKRITAGDFIKNRLLPQLSATKKQIIHRNGKIVDVLALPDHMARLEALEKVLWLHGLYPADTPMPPGLMRDIEFIIPDPPSEPAEPPTPEMLELLKIMEKIRKLE